MFYIILAADSVLSLDNVHLAEVRRGQFRFKWFTDNTTNKSMCPTEYIVESSNCGDCPSVTTKTHVTCNISTINQGSRLCTFSLQSRLCGNIYGNTNATYIVTALQKGNS